MKVVYICSPFSGNPKHNVRRARQFSRYAVDNGAAPITPHLLLPQFMDDNDPNQRARAMDINRQYLSTVDEVWVLNGTISRGMQAEITYANEHNIPVTYHDVDDNYPVDTMDRHTPQHQHHDTGHVGPWHYWFAWRPVNTHTYGWRWLRTVKRARRYPPEHKGIYPYWVYLPLPKNRRHVRPTDRG